MRLLIVITFVCLVAGCAHEPPYAVRAYEAYKHCVEQGLCPVDGEQARALRQAAERY